MNEQDEQQTRDIARQEVINSLLVLASGNLFGNAIQRDILRAEAKRLTDPPAAPPIFEGVRYVQLRQHPGFIRRLLGMTSAGLRLQDPPCAGGEVFEGCPVAHWLPWQPEAGEIVADDVGPRGVGTITRIYYGDSPRYQVAWRWGPGGDCPLDVLRPHMFAADQAKAEPQGLNDGDSVMAYGRVGVLTHQGDEWWVWYHGSGSMGPFLADDLRLATDAEILAAHKSAKE